MKNLYPIFYDLRWCCGRKILSVCAHIAHGALMLWYRHMRSGKLSEWKFSRLRRPLKRFFFFTIYNRTRHGRAYNLNLVRGRLFFSEFESKTCNFPLNFPIVVKWKVKLKMWKVAVKVQKLFESQKSSRKFIHFILSFKLWRFFFNASLIRDKKRIQNSFQCKQLRFSES